MGQLKYYDPKIINNQLKWDAGDWQQIQKMLTQIHHHYYTY